MHHQRKNATSVNLVEIAGDSVNGLDKILELFDSAVGRHAHDLRKLAAAARSDRYLLLVATPTAAPESGESSSGNLRPRGALPSTAIVPAPVWGAAVAGISSNDLSFYEEFGPETVAELAGFRLGVLISAAVALQQRGLGIGQQMLMTRLDWMKARACERAVAVSWLSGSDFQSWPLFEKFGFRCIGEAPTPFYNVSLKDGLVCPTCHGPCICPARAYLLDL